MAKTWNSYSSFFLLSLLLLLALYSSDPAKAAVRTLPAIFIFGDSIVDVGTNNWLNGTAALANFQYYGIDFNNSRPTGRFSNGYNLADQLAMFLGFNKSPPPYLYVLNHMPIFKKKIQRGVNFASAGSGILDDTGSRKWKRVVSMRKQVEQFAYVRGNITEVKGSEQAAKILAKSLYIFSVGSNDIFDYKLMKSNLTKEQFMVNLSSTYRDHLENLYNMGSRKFGIAGVAPLGCCPYARAIHNKSAGDGGCMDDLNDFAGTFYNVLDSLLQKMSADHPDMKYSLGNVYKMTEDFFRSYPSLGFKNIDTACCGNGSFNAEGSCRKTDKPQLCQNRNEFLFWDAYHPSQYAAQLSAVALFTGNTTYMKPINFNQLAMVDV